MKPLFAMLEDKSADLIQMGQHYRNLIGFLEDAAREPEMLLDPDGGSSFPEKYLRRDAWWDAVLEPNEEYDAHTITSLGVMLPALVMFFRKHFKDFLPGGSMENLTAENTNVAGLPKHNKFCETVFGYFDRQLRTTPALSTLTIEAQTMFVFNKTGEWLAAKDDKERSAIIAQSRKDAGSIKAIYKVRYP